ncbi:MAG: flagellar basal body P-ring formation chaperone FlgA [Halocynthiibacter sp.]
MSIRDRTSHLLGIIGELTIQAIDVDIVIAGTLHFPQQAIGLEALVVLYAGRPIRANDVGPAAVIERNQIVTLIYQQGALIIATEARALGRAGPGDRLRVMNLASRSTVSGRVGVNGSVYAGQ